MVVFPNAKINLGLRILRKRPDGYHDLETVFYPLPFYDILEILPANDSAETTLTNTGLIIETQNDENLCIKAWRLLKNNFPSLPAIRVHLHKTIPSGAGLGGGSADASFTLQLLNKQYQLGLDENRLREYALRLGSDCPFFLINQPCVATGRGEQLQPIGISLKDFSIVLVNPGIHVSTAKAFSMLTPAVPEQDIKTIISQPLKSWKEQLINDFEKPVFQQYPEIKNIKKRLYEAGASYASMSGSGSSVFGIFDKVANPSFSFPENYIIKSLHPG